MKSIKQCKELKGKTVFVRVDYNVPLKDGKVLDGFRIDASLATIDFLVKKKAKVVLLAHIGEDGSETLLPVAKYLKRKIAVTFCPAKELHDIEQAVTKLVSGEVLLLENIRQFDGEKTNDKTLAKAVASMGDIFVNDAFSVSHRKHMSVVGLAMKLPAYAGVALEQEVKTLSQALKPKHPFVFILGGAKFDTKLPLLKKYSTSSDVLFVGGALANNVLKEKGYEVGKSVVDDTSVKTKSLWSKKNFLTPIDVVVLRGNQAINIDVSEVLEGDTIVDIGKETIKLLTPVFAKAKLVVWNGPLGWYEKGFVKSTKDLLGVINKSKAQVIIGGGDTAFLAHKMKLGNKVFISTGGGATLDFLANGTLAGISVLSK